MLVVPFIGTDSSDRAFLIGAPSAWIHVAFIIIFKSLLKSTFVSNYFSSFPSQHFLLMLLYTCPSFFLLQDEHLIMEHIDSHYLNRDSPHLRGADKSLVYHQGKGRISIIRSWCQEGHPASGDNQSGDVMLIFVGRVLVTLNDNDDDASQINLLLYELFNFQYINFFPGAPISGEDAVGDGGVLQGCALVQGCAGLAR